MALTKTEEYRLRLLREHPATTKGGKRYQISNNGYNVVTLTNGVQSGFYTACDYPLLFGWDRAVQPSKVREIRTKKPTRIIEYKGYKYVRLKRS